MNEILDVIVLGCGAMGSAACDALAARGRSVLGLEQFTLAHDRGSSHGGTRIIRKAYFEDPRYVPLVRRAWALWDELATQCAETLLLPSGCLNLGPPDHPCIAGVRNSVRQHHLLHELLDAAEVRRRWPVFAPRDTDVAVYEPDAGILLPERCIAALAARARRRGATILESQRVLSWYADAHGVTVRTSAGEHRTRTLVITSGAWLPALVPALAPHLQVERQVQVWFQPPQRDAFARGRMPAFIHFVDEGHFYGIPEVAPPGVKIARHHGGATIDAETDPRTASPADEADVRRYLRSYLPAADSPAVEMKVCLYTNTPDGHFLVARHPHHENVLIAGGFSGHGFKFAPAVGEALAAWIVTSCPPAAFDLFALSRLAAAP